MKKKVPTEVRAHLIDDWAKIKTPKVLFEKLDEYEGVQGESKRPAVPFNNKEKSYRKTLPLNTQSSLPQLERERFKAQSNAVQAEDTTKNIVTAKIGTPESTRNFLAENIDKLKVIRVKCLDDVLDRTVDSGAQFSVVRADLVKDIESTGEGKIKLVSAFGDSEVTPLRTFNIKIDDIWHDPVPITCAVSKKLVKDMLVCENAYEALLENI
ncbi:retrovirus-related Pol polyprotein from transposon opus [Trichonephila inaurata madagascariensis]|uniref:Retrovirus-related Pol polyprotein from transposon opus n=1 Tax=Trichonephila inaurata madagascariensis TaxID=2747483 RepID=A0A8X6XRV3_9ARAC|nr:retrovirus-related Pol polyprotein from transposon opus [Trichonephila inaurata madagascariensis]